MRLQKLMAQAGVASRRVCEEMILDGRVEVDGSQIVNELGVRVDPTLQSVHVDGMRIQTDEKLVYYAFNKPAGVVSTMEDPDGRRCVSDFLDVRKHERVFHVGRLDVETRGLLLLTNDGELTNRLTHPSYHEVPKTYLVQVHGPVEKGIGKQMREGIKLEDGIAKVDSFKLIDSKPGHVLIEVVLHTGRNRIVRRMFDSVGHPVERLARTRVGPIAIGDQRQGVVRKLSRTPRWAPCSHRWGCNGGSGDRFNLRTGPGDRCGVAGRQHRPGPPTPGGARVRARCLAHHGGRGPGREPANPYVCRPRGGSDAGRSRARGRGRSRRTWSPNSWSRRCRISRTPW